MTIFVANFDRETEEGDLRVLFENFGTVNDVYICADRKTGESLGYAFVEMPFDGEAEYAIENLTDVVGMDADSRSMKNRFCSGI